jgi:4'-phosphopantetheinyl transferase
LREPVDETIEQMIGNSPEGPPQNQAYLLSTKEIHLWRANLNWSTDDVARMQQMLSWEERSRADRFYNAVDRTRFIIGRSLTRTLLGHNLGVAAHRVMFEYGSAGKPHLAAHLRQDIPFNFNVSHSGNIVLVALGYCRALGVDVEQICNHFETDEIAKRYFSEHERRCLAMLPTDLRHDAFFACWTRKEAYVKARGDGLGLPLDCFDVAFLPGEAPRLVDVRPPDSRSWSFYDIDCGASYRAALAIEGADHKLVTRDWPDAWDG